MTQLEMGMEGLVDKFSVQAVIDALEAVCRAKEAHIAENWQDMELARKWRAVAARVAQASAFASGL